MGLQGATRSLEREVKVSNQGTNSKPDMVLDPAAVLAVMQRRVEELIQARAIRQEHRLKLLGEIEGLKEQLSGVEDEIQAIAGRLDETQRWQIQINNSCPGGNETNNASGE